MSETAGPVVEFDAGERLPGTQIRWADVALLAGVALSAWSKIE